MDGREVVRKLQRAGWLEAGQRGSHVKMKKGGQSAGARQEGFTSRHDQGHRTANGRETPMSVNLVYPAKLVKAADGCTVTFRDVPGAISSGDSPLQALDEARDALALVIEDILEEGEAIPLPSKARRGEHLVAVPADVGARALLKLIRDTEALSKAAVAERVGVSRQSYGQMEARGRNLTLKTLTDVTEKLGYEVVLEVRPRSDKVASSKPSPMKAGKQRRGRGDVRKGQ